MQKNVSVLISILLLLFIFACAGTTTTEDKKPINLSEEDGDTLWSSLFTPKAVKIDKSFKFLTSKDKSDQKARRKYHVWRRDSGEILYIVDLQIKSSWTFPEDYDPNLGMDQNPNDPNILLYKPMQYSIWKGINKKSYRFLTSMGLKIPSCKAALQVAKLSPSRKSGFWIVLVQENPCGQYGTILDDGQAWITIQ